MLTQERVRELFDYDPETGIVTRKIAPAIGRWAKKGTNPKWQVGSVVGEHGIKTKTRCQVTIDRKLYKLHRIIWLWLYGYLPEHEVDHRNRKPWDNRRLNLREVSPSCNVRNRSLNKTNKSGVCGVDWNTREQKYKVRIKPGYKQINLGTFSDFTEAVAHRLAAEQVLDWAGCDDNSSAYQHMQRYVKGDLV